MPLKHEKPIEDATESRRLSLDAGQQGSAGWQGSTGRQDPDTAARPQSTMAHRIVPTADGSNTILHGEYQQSYHSLNGALQEARHVFLEMGLQYFISMGQQKGTDFQEQAIRIREIGFGAGLNFTVCAAYCLREGIAIQYQGIEPFPVSKSLLEESGYADFLPEPEKAAFFNWYPGTEPLLLGKNDEIRLQLVQQELLNCTGLGAADLVFFDAFAPGTQAEMWSPEAIEKAVSGMETGAVFVSYSITGSLKRILKSLDFAIKKPKGAAGKREMIRATRM